MAMTLDNGRDTVELVDDVGEVVDRLNYGLTSEGVRVTP
jgi:hypothetical protein